MSLTKERFPRGGVYNNEVRQRGELAKTYEQLKAEEVEKYGIKIDTRKSDEILNQQSQLINQQDQNSNKFYDKIKKVTRQSKLANTPPIQPILGESDRFTRTEPLTDVQRKEQEYEREQRQYWIDKQAAKEDIQDLKDLQDEEDIRNDINKDYTQTDDTDLAPTDIRDENALNNLIQVQNERDVARLEGQFVSAYSIPPAYLDELISGAKSGKTEYTLGVLRSYETATISPTFIKDKFGTENEVKRYNPNTPTEPTTVQIATASQYVKNKKSRYFPEINTIVKYADLPDFFSNYPFIHARAGF
jgi:hypothetical protein